MITAKDRGSVETEHQPSHSSLENGDAAEDDPSSPAQNDKAAELANGNKVLLREVTSLRAEKANLEGKVQELEKQLQVDNEAVENLSNEKYGIEQRANLVLSEVSDLRNEVSALKDKQSDLEKEKLSLGSKKEELEVELLKCQTDLTATAKSLEEAKFNYEEQNAERSGLESELFKLYDDEKRLMAEREALEAESREKDELIETLKAQKADLEWERQRLLSDVEEAVEKSVLAKQTIEKLSSEEMRLKDENTRLQSAVTAALQESLALEIQNQTLLSQSKGLEEDILNLQTQLDRSISDHQNILQKLSKEQERKSILEKELAERKSERCSLQGSLESALAEKQKYQEIVKKIQSQISMLGEQVSALIREKLCIEESKLELEAEVKNLTIKSAEVLKNVQQEAADWRKKVDFLERSLEKINNKSVDNEKRMWQLVSELQSVKGLLDRKLTANKYTICAAVASTGSLAALGVVVYLRARKQR